MIDSHGGHVEKADQPVPSVKEDNAQAARAFWSNNNNKVNHNLLQTGAITDVQSTAEIGTTSDGVTDVDPSTWETGYSFMDRNYISGVPDVTETGYREYYYNGSSVGHQYVVIHDDWDSTVQEVYMAYGRNYSYLIQFVFKAQ